MYHFVKRPRTVKSENIAQIAVTAVHHFLGNPLLVGERKFQFVAVVFLLFSTDDGQITSDFNLSDALQCIPDHLVFVFQLGNVGHVL